MNARRPSWAAEEGLVRGCCLWVIVLVGLIVLGAFLGVRALAGPDLGPAPGGTSHGGTESLIAATLAGDAATQLVAGQHAVITLSERDLTVIASARNPSPARFRNPQARIRSGDVVVSAQTDLGPFGVTAVVKLSLVFSDAGGTPQITAQAVDYSVGSLGVPGWIGDRFDPRSASTFNLSTLFGSNQTLQTLSKSLECVSVQPDGLHVGFHRPGVADDASRCASAVAAAT
jgi:hypothetical protein